MSASVDAEAAAPARLFALCWAFAVLYHQIDYREVFSTPLDIVVTAIALGVLLRPSAAALVALAATQLLLMGQQLPRVYNHWYVVGLAGVGVVLAGLTLVRHGGDADTEPPLSRLVDRFAPAGRTFLPLLYFLTGWHKLNTDFLTPGVSCASVLLGQMAHRLGGITFPSWVDHGAILFTLVVELGVPLALVFTRTRGAGVLLALLFHAAMALAGYARFSATGVALLVLFLTPATQAKVLQAPPLRSVQGRAVVLTLLLLSALSAALGRDTLLVAQLLLTAWIGWVVLRQGAGAVLSRPFHFGAGTRVALLAPALLLASGVAPYVGLQTDRAVAMYSNLRTEGSITNHLIVPSSIQYFGYQRDLVGEIASDAKAFRDLTQRRTLIPFAELRARATVAAQDTGVVGLRFRRGGTTYYILDLRSDTTLGLPASLLHRKLFRFRAVEAAGPRQCSV